MSHDIRKCDDPWPHSVHVWTTLQRSFACVGVRLMLVQTPASGAVTEPDRKGSSGPHEKVDR